VSQSTTPQSAGPVVLFQHGSELAEFAEVLSGLAVPVDEWNADLPDPEELEGACLVIISGKRLLESGTPNLKRWPRTIAVVDGSSRTLVNHLSRIGVAMVIRQPIHPRTLRLLLLHEIYRGPERRRRRRIAVGHPIRISSGLFRSRATLVELSPTGARIELANAPKVGSKMRLLVGKELTQTKPLKLRAQIVRSIRGSGKSDRGQSEVGVAILDADRHKKTIKGILDRFALGPAKWKASRPQSEPVSRGVAAHSPIESAATTEMPKITGMADTAANGTHRSLPPTFSGVGPSKVEPEIENVLAEDARADTAISESPGETSDPSTNRRLEERIPYDQRVVALGEEAARVLVGRDLSIGGMRVAATPSIAIGDGLRIAVHGGAQTEPLVILARALRDDGDDGLGLSFKDLSEPQREQLDKIITCSLPVHANDDDLEDVSAMNDAVVVAEVIEVVAREAKTPQ